MSIHDLYNKKIQGTLTDAGGYLPGVKVDDDLKDPSHITTCSAAASLKDLQKDFEIFHYDAMLYRGGMTTDPVLEFASRRNVPKGAIGMVVSDQPILDNVLPKYLPQDTSHTLMLASREVWPDLQQWLDLVAAIDRSRKIFWRALKQRIPITDFLALKKTTVLPDPCPTVDIVTYTLEGNRATFHYVPAKRLPIDRPYLKMDKPSAEMTELANALLSEVDDPLKNTVLK